jgi:4-amino-4-deoxy-L-arabinose transferase-like glycosyltransferase
LERKSPIERVRDGDRISAHGLGRLWSLLPVLVLALLLRMYWVQHGIPVLQGEECEYTRLAEDLRGHHRYDGLFEGPELMYPPFFPALVAVASFVTRDFEAAGRLVSVLAGLALVVAVWGVTRHLYGVRAGLVAATLAACHPVLIALSGTAYSESVDLPLVMGGVYFGLRSMENDQHFIPALCGVCLGLAYLTRPEALCIPFAILTGVVLTARILRRSVGSTLTTALLVLAPFLMLAAPYIAYLSIHTGGLRFEGKSAMNYAIGQRVNAGMSWAEVAFGISPDLVGEGPFLSPNRFVAHAPYGVPVRDVVKYWTASALRNKNDLFDRLVRSPTFGSVLTLAMVTIALLGRPWRRRRLVREAVLLSIVLGYVFILLGMPFLSLRFLMPLLPFVIVWTSKGIEDTGRWAVATARPVCQGRLAVGFGVGARGSLIAACLLLGILGETSFRDESPYELYVKEASEWIAHNKPGPKRVMAVSNEVSYYAGGQALVFPYAPAPLAVDYVHAKDPDFLVLTRKAMQSRPYYREWFEHGIPDPAARLVYRAGPATDPEVLVYEWTKAVTGGRHDS